MNHDMDSAIKSIKALGYVGIVLMIIAAVSFGVGMTAFALGTLSIALALFFYSLGMKSLLLVTDNIQTELENIHDRIDMISDDCSCEEPCECISEICGNDDC